MARALFDEEPKSQPIQLDKVAEQQPQQYAPPYTPPVQNIQQPQQPQYAQPQYAQPQQPQQPQYAQPQQQQPQYAQPQQPQYAQQPQQPQYDQFNPANAQMPVDSTLFSAPMVSTQPDINAMVTNSNTLQNKISRLNGSERQQMEALKNALIVNDYGGISQFGSQASEVVNKLADGVLSTTRANALDMVGDKVNDILCKAKELDVGQLGKAQNPGFIQRFVPWLKVTKEKFMQSFDTVSGQIEKYVKEINDASKGVDNSIQLLENMGKQSVIYYNQLDLLILAGKGKSVEIYDDVDRKKAYYASIPPDSVNPLELQEFQKLQNYADTLDKRISDLERIQQVIYMQVPQIQIMIKNSVDMKNQFQTIINSTIPLWKQQFIQALVVNQQKRGAEVIKTANDFTNELLRQNADNLNTASIAIATEGQRGIIDVETLQHVQAKTINTIETVLDLYKKGRETRSQVSDGIGKMRADFQKTLQGKI